MHRVYRSVARLPIAGPSIDSHIDSTQGMVGLLVPIIVPPRAVLRGCSVAIIDGCLLESGQLSSILASRADSRILRGRRVTVDPGFDGQNCTDITIDRTIVDRCRIDLIRSGKVNGNSPFSLEIEIVIRTKHVPAIATFVLGAGSASEIVPGHLLTKIIRRRTDDDRKVQLPAIGLMNASYR